MKNKYILILLAFITSNFINAQIQKTDSLDNNKTTEKNIDFKVMPFISYNRNVEFMIGGIPMMMYKFNKQDTISPKSLSGMAGVYTTNKSYFVAIFNKFYFNEDKWRGTLYIGLGDFISQFFVDQIDSADFYDFGSSVTFLSIGVQRKVVKNLYGGLTYTHVTYNTVFEDDIAEETNITTNGLELNALYDTRNNVYYPTTGVKIDGKWINYAEWFGNDAEANKIKATYNQYFGMRDKKDVLAARFASTFGLGNIAFEQETVVGGDDIRGYSEGKYRGDTVLSVQAEYRLNFANRMGLVGFAGLATLYGSDNEDFNGELLPGGGVGVRYRAFKTPKLNIGLDAALGKDDWGVYFRIGEAF